MMMSSRCRRHMVGDAPLPSARRGNKYMAMAAATIRWTAEMVRALPDDGKRYEVVDGELLVTPAPSWAHQAASRKLFLRLHPYLASCGIGEAILAPANVEFANDRMVEPDLFVVPLIDGRAPR